jgi:hypothetical protein
VEEMCESVVPAQVAVSRKSGERAVPFLFPECEEQTVAELPSFSRGISLDAVPRGCQLVLPFALETVSGKALKASGCRQKHNQRRVPRVNGTRTHGGGGPALSETDPITDA